jgi:hypothetical protein
MLAKLRSHLTYANVMVTLLAFVVLGGGAYAASKIGASDIARNAVRSKHIKRNAVKTPELANGAVTLRKVKSGLFVKSCGLGSVAAAASWFAPNLPTDGSFVAPNRFGGELGFACAGSGLTATKLATGHYRIQTNGLESTSLIQLANAEPGTGQTRFASSSGPFSGDIFDVFVRDDAGTLLDPSYVSLVLIRTP